MHILPFPYFLLLKNKKTQKITLTGVEFKILFFFLMRKQGKNIIQWRIINTTLFPNLNGFPLLLGWSPKLFTGPLFCLSSLNHPGFFPLEGLCTLSPDLSATSSSPFSRLTQTHPSSFPQFTLSRECLSPQLGLCHCVPISEHPWRAEGSIVAWLNPGGLPCLMVAISTNSLVPEAQQDISQKWKGQKNLFEVLEGLCFLSPPQVYT